jgi:hypothetical protein
MIMSVTSKTAVPAEVLQKVSGYLSKAIKELEPFAAALSSEKKRCKPVLGERSYGFVEKSYRLAAANPKLVPSYLDMKEFEADFSDVHGFGVVRNTALQVLGLLEIIRRVSGSGALVAALKFYQNVRIATKQNIPGAGEAYKDLKPRFKNMGKRKARVEEYANLQAAGKAEAV